MLGWTLLGLMLLAPYLLTIWSRRRALRAGAGGWFDFVQRTQWTALAFCGCWGSTHRTMESAIVPWLARGGLAAWTAPAMIVWLVLPLVAFQLFAAVSVQMVNRVIRGAEVSGDEVLRDQVRALTGLGILFLALCGALGAITLGRWRLALGVALAGILSGTMIGSALQRRPRISPHAVTHGELRDRLFAWASRAGVRVAQLYVVPLTRMRTANALAVQGQSVLVTDYLLTHLSRDELDAVLAHELAHLRLRHPSWLAATLFVGGMGVWSAYSMSSASIAGPAAFIALMLVFMAISRRFEYAADAGAVALGIRAEALITGLARVVRVNHFPQDWSRLQEWTLTHPSNRRRAMRIASRAGIPFERIEGLLNDETPPGDHYSVPAQVREDRVFTTAFKYAVMRRNGWALLFANAAAGAALALLAGRTGLLNGLGALRFVPIGALALVATFMFFQHLGMRPYRSLRSRLWNQQRRGELDPGERTSLWVGLSPDSEPRLYEGLLTWDVGFLDLGSESLEYRGEETSFSLARDDITAIELGPRFPAWVPVFGVVIRWRSGAHEGVFTLLPIQASGLVWYAREARRLRDHLERWRAGRGGPIRGESARIGTPPTGPVTGTAPREAIKPASLVLTMFLQLTIATAVAMLAGLPAWPRRGLGVWDAVLASMMSYLLLITPLLAARLRSRPAADREARKAA